ncbi:glycosyltransferase [Ekhidna sp.]|uniref:glycosyltransferase n=1 Tax=Ekhidna sp. TaxID=2608089 RepID=UPI003CCBE1E1
MPSFSIVVPVYNRPEEIDELLESLTHQSFKDFEVIIIEDGSESSSEDSVKKYQSSLNVNYFYKENTGQGFSRNFGADQVKSDWIIFYDSDCVIPPNYLSNLDDLIRNHPEIDAYCGPDAASSDFSALQKAISYSMTSFLTTGGIRGKKIKVDKETHLRSYNLVMKRSVFRLLGGFAKTNMGEDMELSRRLHKSGHKALISDKLKVYHKRRNSFGSFYKQVFSFGRTRIQLKRHYGIPIKISHLFPSVFFIGLILCLIFSAFNFYIGKIILSIYLIYFSCVLIHSSYSEKSLKVGVLATIAALYQHLAYGSGFLRELLVGSK